MPLQRMTENSRIAADRKRYLLGKRSPQARSPGAADLASSEPGRAVAVADDYGLFAFPMDIEVAGVSGPQPPGGADEPFAPW